MRNSQRADIGPFIDLVKSTNPKTKKPSLFGEGLSQDRLNWALGRGADLPCQAGKDWKRVPDRSLEFEWDSFIK